MSSNFRPTLSLSVFPSKSSDLRHRRAPDDCTRARDGRGCRRLTDIPLRVFFLRLQAFIFLLFIFLGFCVLERGCVFYLVGENQIHGMENRLGFSSSLRHFTRDCFSTSDIQGHSTGSHIIAKAAKEVAMEQRGSRNVMGHLLSF